MGSPRDRSLDRMLPLPPILRRTVWRLPTRFLPSPQHTVWVQAYGFDGELVHDFQAPGDRFGFVTGVREVAGTVYLGSLIGTCVAAFDL